MMKIKSMEKKTPWMRRPRMTVKAISLKFVLGKWW